MLRRAAAIGRQGARPPAPAAAAASALGRRRIHPTGGSTTMQRLLALTSSGGPRRSAFSSSSSSRPHGQQGQKQKQRAVSSLQDGDDEEGDETEMERLESLYREQVALMEERAALGKALLDPAWMHGRRRISAPPQEGIERMNQLSRLLSGRQIRLHASRLSRRPGGAAQQQRRRRPRAEGEAAEDEEDEWDEDEEDGEEEQAGSREGDDEDDGDDGAGGLLEGEAPQGQYYRNSALARPRWAGRAASPPEALAYLATRAVPNFSVVLRVLREAGAAAAAAAGRGGLDGAKPASVLDVGCGPGSGLLAARTLWGAEDGEEGGRRRGLRRLDGVDHSGAMRDLARHLLEPDGTEGGHDGGQQAAPALTLHRHLPPLAQQAARTGERYDVVLASWTLSELPSDASRALAVGLMWELVAPDGGVLVLIEDGSPEGSRLVRSARRLVMEKRGPGGTGAGTGAGGGGGQGGPDAAAAAVARTLAPCPHDRPCPLLRDDWCRFTQRVPLGRLPRGAGGGGGGGAGGGGGGGGRGGGGYKDVAFSYVVIQKWQSGSAGATTNDGNDDARLAALRWLRAEDAGGAPEAQRLHAPTDADWEAATEAVPSRGGWARLIRNPKKAKGHVHLDLCLPTGRLERRVVAKSAAKRLPGKYLAARKAQWGGLWPADKGV